MKSMCQEARRNSPSVAVCSPASRCIATTPCDRGVLDCAQLGGVEPAGREVLAGGQQALGPQQAADVIGAERWAVLSMAASF